MTDHLIENQRFWDAHPKMDRAGGSRMARRATLLGNFGDAGV